jgi:hypothetical protein
MRSNSERLIDIYQRAPTSSGEPLPNTVSNATRLEQMFDDVVFADYIQRHER